MRRPVEVSGTASDFMETVTVADIPRWVYPVFWADSDSNTTPPDFVAVNQTSYESTSRTRSVSTLANVTYNNTTANTRYLWVAYPAGSPTITNVFQDTQTATGSGQATVFIPPTQRSTVDLSLSNPDPNTPADAAENYQWFWLEVNGEEQVTLGATITE